MAGGHDGAIYHIQASAPDRQGAPGCSTAMERCNSWNRAHRWPRAWVADREDGSWRIALDADIDLSPGITRDLFETFTERSVGAMIEFWTSPAPERGAVEAAVTKRREAERTSDGE